MKHDETVRFDDQKPGFCELIIHFGPHRGQESVETNGRSMYRHGALVAAWSLGEQTTDQDYVGWCFGTWFLFFHMIHGAGIFIYQHFPPK